MTALTGETGAGKTLVVEALQLVLGRPGQPRHGAGRRGGGAGRGALRGRGRASEAREVILARSVPADGRSRAWVDGRMAAGGRPGRGGGRRWSRSTGSTSTVRWWPPAAQRDVLDAFAGTDLSRVRAPAQPAARARRRARPRWAATSSSGPARPTCCATRSTRSPAAGARRPGRGGGPAPEEDRLADAAAYREAPGARWPARRRRSAVTAGAPVAPSTCSADAATRSAGARPSTRPGPGSRPPPSSWPTWPTPCGTRSRAGRTIPAAWPRCRSAGASWPTCAASTARTWPP